MNMGRRLRRARLAMKLSMHDVERLTGVSVSTVSRVENDHINQGVRVDMLYKLAQCYGLSVDYLLDKKILVPAEERAQVENALMDTLVAFEQQFDVVVSGVKVVRTVDGDALANIFLIFEEKVDEPISTA